MSAANRNWTAWLRGAATGARRATPSLRGKAGRGRRPWAALSPAALLAVVLCLLWLHLLPQALPIRQVRVEGDLAHLQAQQLQSMAAEMAQGGFFHVNVGAIRARLLAEPWVEAVAVRRRWPDTLEVAVREQTPVAVWNGDGLLNARGDLFARRGEAGALPELPPLPNLSGGDLSGSGDARHELLGLLLKLNPVLQARSLRVVELRRDARRAVVFTLADGTEVKLGGRDIETRANRFIDYVAPHLVAGTRNRYRIDMRYPNGFAVGAAAMDMEGATR